MSCWSLHPTSSWCFLSGSFDQSVPMSRSVPSGCCCLACNKAPEIPVPVPILRPTAQDHVPAARAPTIPAPPAPQPTPQWSQLQSPTTNVYGCLFVDRLSPMRLLSELCISERPFKWSSSQLETRRLEAPSGPLTCYLIPSIPLWSTLLPHGLEWRAVPFKFWDFTFQVVRCLPCVQPILGTA